MTQDVDSDFAFEVAPGLPAPLPEGEEMLWQGRPNVRRLAVESLLLRWVVGYFVFLVFWRFLVTLADHPLGLALASTLPLVAMGAAAAGLIWLVSWLQARATVYTITSARVIMRIGAALQVTFNLPFKALANATLDLRKGGTGTIALEVVPDGRTKLSYLVLWPHVRPWVMRLPQPSLRCIPDAEAVAQLLADAAESQMARPQVSRRAEPSSNDVDAAEPSAVPAE